MKKLFSLIAITLFLFSCNEDSDMTQVSFSLTPVFNGQEIVPNIVIQNVDGRNFSVTELRVYVTDLYLVDANGAKTAITDLGFLDWPTNNQITATVPKNSYKGIEFYIGLDSITNESNPIDFDDAHPLSAQQDMHWAMLDYRFVSFTGNVDSTAAGNGTPDKFLQYHLGRNELFNKVERTADIDVAGIQTIIPITFNMNEMFNGTAGTIDIATHRTNHSGLADMPEANIMVKNLVEAIENY